MFSFWNSGVPMIGRVYCMVSLSSRGKFYASFENWNSPLETWYVAHLGLVTKIEIMISKSDGGTIGYVKFGFIAGIKHWLNKFAGIGLVLIWIAFGRKGEIWNLSIQFFGIIKII